MHFIIGHDTEGNIAGLLGGTILKEIEETNPFETYILIESENTPQIMGMIVRDGQIVPRVKTLEEVRQEALQELVLEVEILCYISPA